MFSGFNLGQCRQADDEVKGHANGYSARKRKDHVLDQPKSALYPTARACTQYNSRDGSAPAKNGHLRSGSTKPAGIVAIARAVGAHLFPTPEE